jgi:serine/threonine protein kinase
VDASGNAKIGDFGLSSEWRKGGILTDSCGSPNYAAPELLIKGCQYEGPEVDVWSLGVVLYTLLCNALPFDAPDFPKLFKLIKSGRYLVPGFVSLDAKDLLGIMIVVDPAKRAQIADIWKHSWFQHNLPAELTAGTVTKKTVAALPMLLGRGTRAGSSFPMVAEATSKHQRTSTSKIDAAAALPARGDKLLKKCASVAVGKSTRDADAAALLAELQAASFEIDAKLTKHGRSKSDEDMTPSTQDATPSAPEVCPQSDRVYSADVAMHAFVNNFAF